MRAFLRLLVLAVVGGLAGSAIRQMVDQKRTGETAEIVVAASTTPIVAGTLAGLLAPRKWRVLVVLLVSSNVAANLKDDPLDPLIRNWIDQQPDGSFSS